MCSLKRTIDSNRIPVIVSWIPANLDSLVPSWVGVGVVWSWIRLESESSGAGVVRSSRYPKSESSRFEIIANRSCAQSESAAVDRKDSNATYDWNLRLHAFTNSVPHRTALNDSDSEWLWICTTYDDTVRLRLRMTLNPDDSWNLQTPDNAG